VDETAEQVASTNGSGVGGARRLAVQAIRSGQGESPVWALPVVVLGVHAERPDTERLKTSKRPPDSRYPRAPPDKDQGCPEDTPQARMALPRPRPPPVATLRCPGRWLGDDFCQVFYRSRARGQGPGARARARPGDPDSAPFIEAEIVDEWGSPGTSCIAPSGSYGTGLIVQPGPERFPSNRWTRCCFFGVSLNPRRWSGRSHRRPRR